VRSPVLHNRLFFLGVSVTPSTSSSSSSSPDPSLGVSLHRVGLAWTLLVPLPSFPLPPRILTIALTFLFLLLVLDDCLDWTGDLFVGVFAPEPYADPEEPWELILDRKPVRAIEVRLEEKVVDVWRVRESGRVKLVVRLIAFNPAGKGKALDPEDDDEVPDDDDRWVTLVVTVGVIGNMFVGVLKPDRAPPGKVRSELKVDKAGLLGGRWCGMGGVIDGDEDEPDEDEDVEVYDDGWKAVMGSSSMAMSWSTLYGSWTSAIRGEAVNGIVTAGLEICWLRDDDGVGESGCGGKWKSCRFDISWTSVSGVKAKLRASEEVLSALWPPSESP
jgi:hypothetical protein